MKTYQQQIHQPFKSVFKAIQTEHIPGCDLPRMQSAAALHRDVTRRWWWRWRGEERRW